MSIYDHIKIFRMASWYIEVYESGIDLSLSLFDFVLHGNKSLLSAMVLSHTGQRSLADTFCAVLVLSGFSLINYGYGNRGPYKSVSKCIHAENREWDGFITRSCPVSEWLLWPFKSL